MLDIAEFGLSIARDLALSRMDDTCVLEVLGEMSTAADGTVTQDRTQIYPNPAWPENHPWASGPCFVQAYDQQSSTQESAGADVHVRRYRIDIPAGACEATVGVVATIITSAHDTALPGCQLRITAPPLKSVATAYRMAAETGVFYTLPEPGES